MIRVGGAKADITPPVGTLMDGFAARTQVSIGMHDKLFSRAIVFEDGAHSAAVVSCDVCWFTEETVAEVKRRTKSFGIDYLLLVATHNHSGPAMADFLAGTTPKGTEYVRELPDRIVDAIRGASAKLEPAVIEMGRGRISISANRRVAGGEVDLEVAALILKGANRRPFAEILNYACHPTVLGQDNRIISGDFPGLTSERIERTLGDGSVCLYTNGACGDVNPRTCIAYDCRGTFADVDEVSLRLANVELNKSGFNSTSNQNIRFAASRIGPLSPFGLEFELNALAIGGFVILGVPGELFASTGMWLKSRCGPRLLIVCYANGYVGYFPTKEAFHRRDYETQTVCWVEEDAEEQIRAKGVTLFDTISRVL